MIYRPAFLFSILASILFIGMAGPAIAQRGRAPTPDPSGWAALASDRLAHRAGDSLTVLIYEQSTASNTAQNGTRRTNTVEGDISIGDTLFNEGASLHHEGGFEGASQTSRTGRLAAQMSVLVEEVLPNGDLKVGGAQKLTVNGERTEIQVHGLVRPADIASNNTVLSTRLADVTIDYTGSGFVTRGSQPSVAARVLNWLGVL